MANKRGTKSLAAAAIMGLFVAHAATAQQTQSLPPPAGSTAHFVYFSTGSHALTPEDQDHIRDVAGMMQSTPAFIATIIGKADSVGSADFNEHLSQRRAEAVFEALVYTHKVPENRVQLRWTGERLPYISTADEQAESQNRMVAIIVSDDPSHVGSRR
jgi:outer membrane protein OmpA-like peptidoglycan-associated protein